MGLNFPCDKSSTIVNECSFSSLSGGTTTLMSKSLASRALSTADPSCLLGGCNSRSSTRTVQPSMLRTVCDFGFGGSALSTAQASTGSRQERIRIGKMSWRAVMVLFEFSSMKELFR